MKKIKNIEITELFMAKAGNDFSKCFHGTIRRTKGTVYGKIKVNDGYIVANGKDQWELGDKLDQLVLINLMTNLGDNEKAALN